jgi:hypothetical protein
MEYSEFRKTLSEKMSGVFAECNLFFAYNTEQFEEAIKEKGLQGVKITGMGGGAYLPSANTDLFMTKLTEHEAFETKLFQQVDVDEAIEYELANHECYWTWNLDDIGMNDIFKSLGIEPERVQKVFNATVHKYEQ